MPVAPIEIHIGKPDFEFQPIGRLEATCEATSMDTVNAKLREMAAGQGADAVIDVQYRSGMSDSSRTSMTATGLAVRKLHAETPCSNCGEMIHRGAKHCRFCGHTLTEPGSIEAIQQRVAMFTPPPPLIAIPPPRKRFHGRRQLPIGLTIAVAVAVIATVVFVVRMLRP